MENLLKIATLLISNSIYYYVLVSYFELRYDFTYQKKLSYFIISILFVIQVLINMLNIPVFNLLYSFVTIILLSVVVFRIKNKSDYIINLLFFLILLFIDAGASLFIDIVVSSRLTDCITISIKQNLSTIIMLIVFILSKSYLVTKKANSLKKIELLYYAIITIINFIIIAIGVLINVTVPEIAGYFFAITVMIIFFNFFAVKMLDFISKSQQLEEEIALIERSSNLMFTHYSQLEENEQNKKYILHDIKNHLQTLESFIDEEKKAYLSEIELEVNKLLLPQFTDRKILNVLFNEKLKEAKRKQIKLEIYNDESSLENLSDYDLITIFANLIDNALEAVEMLTLEKRVIHVYQRCIKNHLVIRISNNCDNQICKKGNKILSSKVGHKGLGLLSIENTIKKYDGTMVTGINEENKFVNTITIPLI